jgi:hypothetical protein
MALNLYYGRIKSAETRAALCPDKAHTLLESMGFALMHIGVNAITPKTIDDVTRRIALLHDLGHPCLSYYAGNNRDIAYCPPRQFIAMLDGFATNVSPEPYGAWAKRMKNPKSWFYPGRPEDNATLLQEAAFWTPVLEACKTGTPLLEGWYDASGHHVAVAEVSAPI